MEPLRIVVESVLYLAVWFKDKTKISWNHILEEKGGETDLKQSFNLIMMWRSQNQKRDPYQKRLWKMGMAESGRI